ncbi:hypothetical protein JCM8208_002166 [Rhodotorula glutinis]
MLVPEPSRSLYPSKLPELRAHIVVDGKPRLVFDMKESGNKVSGFVSGVYDSEFEVRLWDGRTKKATRGYERILYFGDQEVSGFYHKAGTIEYQGAADVNNRFCVWSEVRVDDEHTRPFKFGPVPTTDSRDRASRDAKFLDGVSAIKIEYRKIHNVKTKVDRKPKNQIAQSTTGKTIDPLDKQKKDTRAVHEQQEKGQFGVAASFGDLKTVKKYVDNGKKTTTTYDYVNKDEPDVVFVFYIRSDPWIRARLADEEPEEVERSVTPPVEVGDTLYIGMTESEIEAEEQRAPKRPRVDKAPQDKGKRVVRPLSRSPSPTSTHADSPLDAGDLGGEDPLVYPMSDDDSGSDGDSYLHARPRPSSSSGPVPKKARFSSAGASASPAPGAASTDLVAVLQAQLAQAEAANARLRAQLEHRPNKRKELGDAAPHGSDEAHVEPLGPLETPSSEVGGSMGPERVDGEGSHSSTSSSTTMASTSVAAVVGAKSSSSSSSSAMHIERTEVAVSKPSAPLALAPAPAPVAGTSRSSLVVRPDSSSHSSAAPQPLGASDRSTAVEPSLLSTSSSVLGTAAPTSAHRLTDTSLSMLDSASTAPLAPFNAPANYFSPPPAATHKPHASRGLLPMTSASTVTLTSGPATADGRAASVGGDGENGGGQAFSLVPVGDEAQRRLEIKLEANEQRLAAEAAEEHLAVVGQGDAPQNKLAAQEKIEVKPEQVEECLGP